MAALYGPLGRWRIRLVTILPGAEQDPITCHLSEVSVENPSLSFSALSYVWGNPKSIINIRLQAGLNSFQDWPVTSNLSIALRNLRCPDKSKTLWIDSLCINQLDLDERASQVRLMREIYAKAETVIVWLGSAERQVTARVADFVEAYNDELQKRLVLGRPFIFRYSKAREAVGIIRNLILSHSWWDRIWVVQELTVSRKAIVHFGRDSFAWSKLSSALDYLARPGGGLGQVRIQLRHRSSAAVAEMRSTWEDSAATVPYTLLELLLEFRDRDSTDPRDKVFALLGLVQEPGNAPLPLPDYTLSTESVYRNVVLYHFAAFHNLDIICAAGWNKQVSWMKIARDHVEAVALPSWIPDWRKGWFPAAALDLYSDPRSLSLSLQRSLASPRARRFRASGHTTAGFPLGAQSHELTVLSVTGLPIDTLETVDRLPFRTPLRLLARWEKCLEGNLGSSVKIKRVLDGWISRFAANSYRQEGDPKFGTSMMVHDCIVDGNATQQPTVNDAFRLRQQISSSAQQDQHPKPHADSDKILTSIADRAAVSYIGGGELVEAYYRTLIVDQTSFGDRAGQDYIACALENLDPVNFPSLTKFAVEGDRTVRLIEFGNELIAAFQSAVQWRTLFITAQGYIGLGPLTMRPKDQVVVLFGCSVPVILRPRKTGGHLLIGVSIP